MHCLGHRMKIMTSALKYITSPVVAIVSKQHYISRSFTIRCTASKHYRQNNYYVNKNTQTPSFKQTCLCYGNKSTLKTSCMKFGQLFDSGSLHQFGAYNVLFTRGYATKKGKKSKKGHEAKARVELSHEELHELINYTKMKEEMDRAVEHLKHEYVTQLSLRTSPGVFDRLTVETPDGSFPLNQIAQVSQKNPNLVVVSVATAPQYTNAVKNAIINSGMNVNPQQEGTTLFVPLPKVTREHREGLAKSAKTLCDKTKEKLRHIQNSYTKSASKGKDHHSQDLIRNVIETVQVTTKQYNAHIEEMKTAKEKELLGK